MKLRRTIVVLVLLSLLAITGVAQAATFNCPAAGNQLPTYYYQITTGGGQSGQCTDGQCADNQCTDNQCANNQCTNNQCTNNQRADNYSAWQRIISRAWPAAAPVEPPATDPAPAPAPTPAPTPGSQPAASGQAEQYERQVLDLVNARRAEAQLAPLAWDDRLAALARTKSEDMRDNNYFSHQSPTLGSAFDMLRKAGISYTYAGENIAAGQQTPAQVVAGWMSSPGHRANILNPRFTRLGVGFAAGGSYGTYWTQMFIGD